MSKYFLYVRKSTDETKRQLLSLDAQVRELRDLAKRERLAVVEFLEESRTAKAPGRPIFNAMLDRIERGEADGILVWDIDRLYRNPADEGRVRWMLQREIITSIRTASRDYGPTDAGLLIAVEGGRATDFIIHHTRDVARGVRQKLLSGAWPGARPVGYVYDHSIRNIVPDPKKAKLVRMVFEEFSPGRHGLVWVSDRLAELGIVNESGKHWSKSQAHGFLTNKLYVGIMVWKGESFEGKYQSIVSPELFAKVADALKVRSKPRFVRKGHNFAFCGLLRCNCGRMITAQLAKGHGGLYRYYRCTSTCGEKYVREEDLTEQLLGLLAPLSITSEEAAHVRQLIAADAEKDCDQVEASVAKTSERLAKIQESLNKLTRSYVNEILDEDSYQQATADLLLEKAALKKQKTTLHRKGSALWIEPALDAVNALESAAKQQTERQLPEISRLVQKTQLNLLVSRKKVTAGFASPYLVISQILAELRREFAVNALPHGDRSKTCDVHQISLRSMWCPGQDSNLHALRHTPLKRVCLPIPPPGHFLTRKAD